MSKFEVDCTEIKEFINELNKIKGETLKNEFKLFIDGLGLEFLRIVSDEIKSRNVVDTRMLLASFTKGDVNNCWKWTDGYQTLEIGSLLEYAAPVNDGHWTCKKGKPGRFVPGDVVLDANGKVIEFTYNPKAKTGIYLKQQWIKARPYFSYSFEVISNMLPEMMEAKIDQIFERYF